MRTFTLAIVVTAAALIGCGSKAKPKPTTTTEPVVDPNAGKKQVPVEDVAKDQQVSPGLAISGDIIALCNLKIEAAAATPKFEYDKDELTEADRKVLDQIATCLISGPLKGKTVSLIGRADPRGTDEYNLGLGSRRAHSVSQYLGRLGVGQPQMAVTTRGALDAKGTDEATWREDRRVDIQLASPGA